MKIQWEYDLVEKPFCQQLERLGWQWIEGDPDLPETTERTSSREVLLKGRLAAAVRKLNLRDGQPWLDDARITRAVRDLEQAAGHRLMEVNQFATELLLKGTVTDGLPDWDQGRPQPLRFIDFENPANNDFLVINQFKVERPIEGTFIFRRNDVFSGIHQNFHDRVLITFFANNSQLRSRK